jgi:hypothetical protein
VERNKFLFLDSQLSNYWRPYSNPKFSKFKFEGCENVFNVSIFFVEQIRSFSVSVSTDAIWRVELLFLSLGQISQYCRLDVSVLLLVVYVYSLLSDFLSTCSGPICQLSGLSFLAYILVTKRNTPESGNSTCAGFYSWLPSVYSLCFEGNTLWVVPCLEWVMNHVL